MTAPKALLPILLLAMAPSFARAAPPEPTMEHRGEHPVYELRQYTLHPCKRDVLIGLFEDRFIEPLERDGMQVPAHFRDLDNPDRFAWFRRFEDMESRGRALPAFYRQDPVWQQYRNDANATMIDSDNVLLLREAWPGSGFAAAAAPRPPVGAKPHSKAVVVATTYALVNPVDDAFIAFFRDTLAPRAQVDGAKLLATFVTEESPNNFPPLPVRPEHVLAWVAAFADDAAYARYRERIASDPRWARDIAPTLAQRLVWPADVHRLRPAARSLLQD
jgi:hypothetical protein